MSHTHTDTILILDFGSQYTQLITRKVRELGVYSEIRPYRISIDEIRALSPRGIILSGGPASVYEAGAPKPAQEIFELGVPVLGVCYGLQLIAERFGASVRPSNKREYGAAALERIADAPLLEKIESPTQVWMSHGDAVDSLPDGFETIARTDNAPFAAIRHAEQPIFGLQFHPEVAHTTEGKQLLANFVLEICGCKADWTPANFVQAVVSDIQEEVGDGHVLCALSGGVDSVVAAALAHRAIGDRLHCVFVDTGLMRLNEGDEISDRFKAIFGSGFAAVEAGDRFFARLAGTTDPEEKRKRIGAEFIRVFENEARRLPDVEYLLQGTLYPDVIESVSPGGGPSVTIKTHHNVGGLPEDLGFKLIEPLRELFKDEVRRVGRELGLDPAILGRHPFPGPGLAVRILGEVTRERVDLLQRADAIFIDELRRSEEYDRVWQAFAVLLPVQTVGVMGDLRTYENAVALRAVTSVDGMTADWARLPADVLARASNRIINEIRGINRVVYDISSKPPATIEWE